MGVPTNSDCDRLAADLRAGLIPFPPMRRPFVFGHCGCDGKYRMSDDEKRAAGLMKCPYCGCECDSSAVGDHAIDCEGYGENARTGPDE